MIKNIVEYQNNEGLKENGSKSVAHRNHYKQKKTVSVWITYKLIP